MELDTGGPEQHYEDNDVCAICRLAHFDARKHVYTAKHKKNVKYILRREGRKIQEAKYFLKNVMRTQNNSSFWCYFCEANVDAQHLLTESFEGFANSHVFEHLGSKAHRKYVRLFWKFANADRDLERLFVLNEEALGKYQSAVNGLLDAERRTVATNSHVYNPATDPTFERTDGSNNTTSPAPPAPKTVRNHHGIEQNPTGKAADGRRVWGGGIVKYPRGSKEWLSWPIDEDQGGDSLSGSIMGAECDQGRASALPATGPLQTMTAYATGLTQIQVPQLRQGQGNVHSGAKPPWLQDDETTVVEETPEELVRRVYSELGRKQRKLNPKRVGAGAIRKLKREDADDTWLPSFGRVFINGARAETKQTFQEERKLQNQGDAAPRLSFAELMEKHHSEAGNPHIWRKSRHRAAERSKDNVDTTRTDPVADSERRKVHARIAEKLAGPRKRTSSMRDT